MATTRLPKNVAALIKTAWPEGAIEEFDTDESGFLDIQAKLERDLRKIPSASLRWQTEPEEGVYWDDGDDDFDEAPPRDWQFQSYHVFFLVPDGDEFRSDDETEDMEPPDVLDEEDEEWVETQVPGGRWVGCAVAVSLAGPVALVTFSSYGLYQNGTTQEPSIDACYLCDDPGESITAADYYRREVVPEGFQKLEGLRARIVEVCQKHRLEVLDDAVLDLPVTGLTAAQEVFVEPPVRVRDAFFFRGV